MKSILKSFNIENAVLPLSYTSDLVKLNENGFILSTYNLYDFLKLEIGKKYYTIDRNKAIMAFKVLRIVCFEDKYCHDSLYYEVKLADGHILRLDVLTDIYGCKFPKKDDAFHHTYKIFETKDDVFNYRKTKDDFYIYNKTWSLSNIIATYFKNEFCEEEDYTFDKIDIIHSVKRIYTNYYIRGYFLDKDTSLKYYVTYFKYFWIDDCGGHYQVYDMVGNTKVYLTKEDALNTLKVYDFDDDDNEEEKKEEVTIQMNVNKTDIWKVANKLKEIGLYISIK